MRNREMLGLVAVATAAVIFSFAAPSFGQNAGQGKGDNGVGQGIIPTPPGQNPGQQGQFGKGKGKAKRAPSRPTPHGPDGHVLLGPLPGEHGVWNGNRRHDLMLVGFHSIQKSNAFELPAHLPELR